MGKNHLALIVAINVALVWTAVILAGLITHDYEALTYVTPVMLTVAGYLFGDNLLRKRTTRSEDDNA